MSGSRTCSRTVATCPGAAATTASQPGGGEPGVRGAPVLGAGEPLDQAAVLEPAHDVREPRQGGVGALGERRHPQACARAPRRASRGRSTRSGSGPQSRRSWASSTPGSSSTTATSRSHAARSSASSHLGVHDVQHTGLLDGTTITVECVTCSNNQYTFSLKELTMAHISIIGTGNMGQAIAAVAGQGRPHRPAARRRTTSTPPSPATSSSSRSPTPPSPTSSPQRGESLAGKIVVDITNPLNFETFDSLTVARRRLGRRRDRRRAARVARAQGVQHHLRRARWPPAPSAR